MPRRGWRDSNADTIPFRVNTGTDGYRAAQAVRLDEVRRLRAEPPDAQELARRRAYGEAMDRVRAKVGHDFDAVQAIRDVREGGGDAVTEPVAGHDNRDFA